MLFIFSYFLYPCTHKKCVEAPVLFFSIALEKRIGRFTLIHKKDDSS